jgi:hypothetical protein
MQVCMVYKNMQYMHGHQKYEFTSFVWLDFLNAIAKMIDLK